MKVNCLDSMWLWAVQAAEKLKGEGPGRRGCPVEAKIPQGE